MFRSNSEGSKLRIRVQLGQHQTWVDRMKPLLPRHMFQAVEGERAGEGARVEGGGGRACPSPINRAVPPPRPGPCTPGDAKVRAQVADLRRDVDRLLEAEAAAEAKAKARMRVVIAGATALAGALGGTSGHWAPLIRAALAALGV